MKRKAKPAKERSKAVRVIVHGRKLVQPLGTIIMGFDHAIGRDQTALHVVSSEGSPDRYTRAMVR